MPSLLPDLCSSGLTHVSRTLSAFLVANIICQPDRQSNFTHYFNIT